MLTPTQAWLAIPVATPPDPPRGPAPRPAAVLTRQVSSSGSVSLGDAKIQVGTTFTGQHVLVTEDGTQAHVYDKAGILIRSLTLDAQTAYYPFSTRGGYRGRRKTNP